MMFQEYYAKVMKIRKLLGAVWVSSEVRGELFAGVHWGIGIVLFEDFASAVLISAKYAPQY
jgi:hypothetical protein